MAAVMVASIGKIASPSQGVACFERHNGTLKGGRHVTGGRRRPRDVLYMAAMAACMHNAEMAGFYERLVGGASPTRSP